MTFLVIIAVIAAVGATAIATVGSISDSCEQTIDGMFDQGPTNFEA